MYCSHLHPVEILNMILSSSILRSHTSWYSPKNGYQNYCVTFWIWKSMTCLHEGLDFLDHHHHNRWASMWSLDNECLSGCLHVPIYTLLNPKYARCWEFVAQQWWKWSMNQRTGTQDLSVLSQKYWIEKQGDHNRLLQKLHGVSDESSPYRRIPVLHGQKNHHYNEPPGWLSNQRRADGRINEKLIGTDFGSNKVSWRRMEWPNRSFIILWNDQDQLNS